jgi:hypothetical protein
VGKGKNRKQRGEFVFEIREARAKYKKKEEKRGRRVEKSSDREGSETREGRKE